MALLEEHPALVFLVPFTVGGDTWTVRLKQHVTGDKSRLEVVDAVGAHSPRKNAAEWEEFLAQRGQGEEFWASAIHEFLRIAGGGGLAEA
jgi:hypothetical protein